MTWRKLGLVYRPEGEYEWARSHGSVPTSMMLDDDRIRVYVSFLDRDTIGRIGFVDVDARDPLRVLGVSERPVLDLGAAGTFDDSGVMPVSIVRDEGKVFLYYIGWQRGTRVRYYLFVGLAVSEDGGDTFRRCSQVPVLDRSDGELFVRTAAHVRRDEGRWRMWYVAGDKWIDVKGKQVPTYNMRYLESPDKAVWGKEGRVCLDLEGDDEYGFGRPFVVREGSRLRMWYSIRTVSKGYRLGYAESTDGLQWERRDDEFGLGVSATGWDSEMVCYGCLQDTKHGTYLFYNGNNFGETGFGVAVRLR